MLYPHVHQVQGLCSGSCVISVAGSNRVRGNMQMLDLGARRVACVRRHRPGHVTRLNRAPVVSVAAPEAPVVAETSAPAPVTESVTSSANVKLPSTHLESSKRALEQLKESAINSEFLPCKTSAEMQAKVRDTYSRRYLGFV